MSQSKLMSFMESCSSNIFAFIISVLIQGAVFHAYGFDATIADNIQIVLLFTGISIIRGFAFRRLFDWLGEAPINYIKRKLK